MAILSSRSLLTPILDTNPSPSVDMLEVVDEDYSTHRMVSSMYGGAHHRFQIRHMWSCLVPAIKFILIVLKVRLSSTLPRTVTRLSCKRKIIRTMSPTRLSNC